MCLCVCMWENIGSHCTQRRRGRRGTNILSGMWRRLTHPRYYKKHIALQESRVVFFLYYFCIAWVVRSSYFANNVICSSSSLLFILKWTNLYDVLYPVFVISVWWDSCNQELNSRGQRETDRRGYYFRKKFTSPVDCDGKTRSNHYRLINWL